MDPNLQNDPLNFSQVSKTTGPLAAPATSRPTEPIPTEKQLTRPVNEESVSIRSFANHPEMPRHVNIIFFFFW